MTREEIRCVLLYGPFREDGIPADLAHWSEGDLRTAHSLAREKADRARQECEYADWLETFLHPVCGQHPERTFAEIAGLLPEPEKTFAKDHLESTFNWYALPFECRKNHRRQWHTQAEDALLKAFTRDRGSGRFGMAEVVREAGIPPQHQQAAAEYLERLMSEQSH